MRPPMASDVFAEMETPRNSSRPLRSNAGAQWYLNFIGFIVDGGERCGELMEVGDFYVRDFIGSGAIETVTIKQVEDCRSCAGDARYR